MNYIKVAFVAVLLAYTSMAEAGARELAFFPDALSDDRPVHVVAARAGAGDAPAADNSWVSWIGSSVSYTWTEYISPVGILKDIGDLAGDAYQAVKAEIGRNVNYVHRVYTQSIDIASFWDSCRRAEELPALSEEVIRAKKARKHRMYNRVQAVAAGSVFLLGFWAYCTPIQSPASQIGGLSFDLECARACNGYVYCSAKCFHIK